MINNQHQGDQRRACRHVQRLLVEGVSKRDGSELMGRTYCKLRGQLPRQRAFDRTDGG